MRDARAIVTLHQDLVRRWHVEPLEFVLDGWLGLVADQHRFNFLLWHEEDQARDPHAGDRRIAIVKRAIDRLNQQRNDGIEKLDDYLIASLLERNLNHAELPTHSETVGCIIDRLSILALRLYHMAEQAQRADASPVQRSQAEHKLLILQTQALDLTISLQRLLDDLWLGRKQLRVYRQFKMYNDPTMNPVLYQPRAA